MTRNVTRRTALKAIGLGVGGLAASGGVTARGSGLERLIDYDPDAGELPENVATNPFGFKFVSMPPRAEIRAIGPDNETQSTFATFDVGEGNGVIGVEALPFGTVFACVVSDGAADSDEQGIWRVSPRGERSLVAPVEAERFPNDLIVHRGSLLVTDSVGGAVLRVDDGEADVWVEDPLLEGDGSSGSGFPVGANGIVESRDGTVYVANTELGHVVEIPVNRDGSAGTPEVFVADERLVSADGMGIDVKDDLYVAMNQRNTVARVTGNGSIETLATADDGLDNPSDVTFGAGRGERTDVFVTNFALFSQEDPSFAKLDVGIPGQSVFP